MRPLALLALALSSLALAPGAAAECGTERECTPNRPIRVPTLAYPTIQSAVDAAPPGGTILVAPGVYHETILVQGKSIRIIGSEERDGTLIARSNPARLVPADDVVGILNYENGGGGEVQNLRLAGGDAGILAHDGREAQPVSGLKVRNVEIAASGHGILWASSAGLEVKESTITDTLGNGILLLNGSFKGSYLGVFDAQKAGLYFSNTVADVDNTLVGFNGVAGIYISQSIVTINNSSAFNNTRFGIVAIHSFLGVNDTSAYSNKATPPPENRWGDGIATVLSHALLDNIVSSNNDRAGLSNFGGYVKLSDSELDGNAFDLEGETVPADALFPGDPPSDQGFTIADGGNNVCNGGTCLLETVGIQPPEPATPID